MAWTDERVATVRKLWADGLSASQIAMRLGGVTRSAVIGKVWRLGLQGRAPTSRLQSAKRPKSKKQKRPTPFDAMKAALAAAFAAAPIEPPPMPDKSAPADQRRSLLELEPHHCRWPIGDVREPDFHFCGAQKVAGLSYCLAHARKAYQPPQPKRSVPVAVPVKTSEGV